MKYTVIVGNIGTVHNGPNKRIAHSVFMEYKDQSIRNYGRAAGESVVLLGDNEPIREFVGKMDKAIYY